MSRALFMAKLKEGLAGMPQPEIDAVVSDYEFHFAEAAAAGQTEEDVAARLGDPARLARELRGDTESRRSADAGVMPSMLRERRKLALLLLVIFAAVGAETYYLVIRNGAGASAPSAHSSVVEQRPMPVPAKGIRLEISGDQIFDLGTITQEHLEIVIDGGGRATAKGRVRELTVHVDGSGTANFGAVQADIVHVDVSGTGAAEVSAAQMADVTISGSGSVRLRIKPKTLRQSVTGSGQVILPG
jgi:hypothetical protein